MTFAERLAGVVADTGPLCLGIDPHPALLEGWGLPDDAAGVREFGLRAVDAAHGGVGIVKPQVAFFERHGSAGFGALEEVMATARRAGLVVIADAKRGDIGSTAEGYADAWLRPGSPLEADAVTASPYLGVDALDPLLRRAAAEGKGVFVLAATSNPEAVGLQTARRGDGVPVARDVVDQLRRWTSAHGAHGAAGVVLGATLRLADYGIDPGSLGPLPILAPGFGTQGARLDRIAELFGAAAPQVIASVSRSVLSAGAAGVADALAAARAQVRAA
ncbi:MAG: orotidine-5'-phosphate decarboxylase [Micrococcales bacterium]|nr:orotidine-5'-phosphate decarboxylase [Micrococcales bacterium]